MRRAAPPRIRRRRAGRSGPCRRPPWCSRCATCLSKASPTGWPSVSLTFLKRSRSIRNKAQAAARPAAFCSASSSVRRISMRLGRPVSESYLARRLISSSERRCWVRSVPMPRKPRKRPCSSKLGVPESDHQVSAAVLARTVTSVKGRRAERWKPSVRSDVRAAPSSAPIRSMKGAADQILRRGLEVGGEMLGDVGEGAAPGGFPEPAAAGLLELLDERTRRCASSSMSIWRSGSLGHPVARTGLGSA